MMDKKEAIEIIGEVMGIAGFKLLFGGDTEQILTALIHRAEKQLKLEKKRMIEESTQNRSQLFLRGRSRNELRPG